VQVEPEFKVDDNTLGAELMGVIITGASAVIHLIIHWLESRKNKMKKDETANKFFLNITYYNNEGDELDNVSENMTLEQIGKMLEDSAPNRRKFELGLKIKKVNFKSPQNCISSVKKILIISATPKMTNQLRLDEEVREIEEGLRRSKHRSQFQIQLRLAARLRDLRRALLDYESHIVHFSGHGKEEGILVEDEIGFAVPVSTDALSGLFELFSDRIECVILSACYSARQAAAINRHINYVIGMQKEIEDKAAIEFAVGFYDALGAGKTIEEAFKFGRNAVQLEFPGQLDYLIPVLKKGNIKDLK